MILNISIYAVYFFVGTIWIDSIWIIIREWLNIRKLKELRRKTKNKKPKSNIKFLIIVPLYMEGAIINEAFNRFLYSLGKEKNIIVVFVTVAKEVPKPRRNQIINMINSASFSSEIDNNGLTTPELLHKIFIKHKKDGTLPDHFKHVINPSQNESGKYIQLTFALERFRTILKPTDFIGVYDADSLPDRQSLDFVRSFSNECAVFQQLPLYPPLWPIQGLSQIIAHSRILLNFHYMLSREATIYLRSYKHRLKNSIGANIAHLIGHGEYIRLDALEKAGGFLPPSCDSTLGFSLGMLGYSICPIPVVDFSSTPNTIHGIYRQGIVWFNGISLFLRERKRLSVAWNMGLIASYAVRLCDNFRWAAYPFIVILSIFTFALFEPLHGLALVLVAVTGFMLRDIFGFFYYNKMKTWTSLEIPHTPCWYWFILSIIHALIMRPIWTFPPWQVIIFRLLGLKIKLFKTKRV